MCVKYRTLQIARGGELSWYAELNCNLLENFCSYMHRLLCSYMYRLFHWKTFAITDQFAKTAKFSTVNDLQYTVFPGIIIIAIYV